MASIDAQPLFPLAGHDIAGCVALSAEAGWNQTPDDWRLFFDRGTVFGLLGADGRPVATGAILPYGEHVAWISMVLVTASRRRARIGTRILKMCCTELTQRGLIAVLDATPAGEQVYRPLGFEPLFKLTRWQGAGGGCGAMPAGIRPMREGDLAAVADIDAAALGARRSFLLDSFYRRAPHLAFMTDSGGGFALARPGRIATQIGPIVAADEATAAALLDAALDTAAGPVFLDLCDRWNDLVRQLDRRGFTVQRPYLRMALRHRIPFGDPARTFVVAGPEFG
jgi:hypothetical protein